MLSRSEFQSQVEAAIENKSLLKHPFYQAWNAGTLPMAALQQYAAQYYHFELAFPTFLSAVHTRTPHLAVRQQILNNIWDEENGPDNHTELWLRFCDSLGLDRAAVEASEQRPETAQLIGTYRAVCGSGHYSQGLAALLSYEGQVPAVATQKIAGLKANYGISAQRDISFFTAHIEADTEHSATERDLVLDGAATAEQQAAALAAVDQALDGLWNFLSGVYQMEPARA